MSIWMTERSAARADIQLQGVCSPHTDHKVQSCCYLLITPGCQKHIIFRVKRVSWRQGRWTVWYSTRMCCSPRRGCQMEPTPRCSVVGQRFMGFMFTGGLGAARHGSSFHVWSRSGYIHAHRMTAVVHLVQALITTPPFTHTHTLQKHKTYKGDQQGLLLTSNLFI